MHGNPDSPGILAVPTPCQAHTPFVPTPVQLRYTFDTDSIQLRSAIEDVPEELRKCTVFIQAMVGGRQGGDMKGNVGARRWNKV